MVILPSRDRLELFLEAFSAGSMTWASRSIRSKCSESDESGRESITITVKVAPSPVIGASITLFEHVEGLCGSYVNVNVTHELTVETGKKAATTVVGLQLSLTCNLKLSTISPGNRLKR